MLLKVKQSKWLFFISAVCLLLSVVTLSYYVPRENFVVSYGLILISFLSFYVVYESESNVKWLFGLGLGVRVFLLFSTPELSDDFYRFLWDGAVSESGHNPFLYKPSQLLNNGWLREDFINKFSLLNSPEYYTVYPSFIQFIDWVSVLIGRSFFGSMLTMKVFFLIGELTSFYFLRKILKNTDRAKVVFLYWLCPLIIIEFIGNLHFEAFMVTFILGSFYFFRERRFIISALFFALSFHTKLIPLIFIPFFLMNTDRSLKFFIWSVAFMLLGSVFYFFDGAYLKILESVQLYFGDFEFNSGLAYIGQIYKHDHFWVTVVIKLTHVSLLFLWCFYSYRRRVKLPLTLGVMYGVYLLFSQSVHPWYILPLLPLFMISKVPVSLWCWFLLIPLSYITYRTEPYLQEDWVRIVEYCTLLSFMLYDIWKCKKCALE